MFAILRHVKAFPASKRHPEGLKTAFQVLPTNLWPPNLPCFLQGDQHDRFAFLGKSPKTPHFSQGAQHDPIFRM
jgi:hypothetical protein